jgi:fatty-acyl-CoA synthase
MLPHRTVCANLDAIAIAAELDPDVEVMVSWLPLYHDMGLVGFLILPMSYGVELVLGAPQDFLGDPSRWMRWMSTYGGTATAGPNFAWVLATRALTRSKALDLSPMRIALNGAEPVDCAAVDRFIDAAVPYGLRPGAVYPAFGMAELVIAGTFPKPMQGLRVDRVDRDALELERRAVPCTTAAARDLAILGRAVPGLSLRIVDPATGEVRGEREVGELQITGTSVTSGYYKHPEANDALFDGEWLRTGDLAYLVGGEMVMCGRIKDVIIIGGRNIFPDEVERAVGDLDGVRAGNVVAFGVDSARGKEAIVIVAETNSDDAHDVARHMAQRVIETVGLPPKDIVLVGGGTLPKTSSGKLQRSLCRTLYSTNTLADIRWQSHAIRR